MEKEYNELMNGSVYGKNDDLGDQIRPSHVVKSQMTASQMQINELDKLEVN